MTVQEENRYTVYERSLLQSYQSAMKQGIVSLTTNDYDLAIAEWESIREWGLTSFIYDRISHCVHDPLVSDDPIHLAGTEPSRLSRVTQEAVATRNALSQDSPSTEQNLVSR